jgi:hypothetical protein
MSIRLQIRLTESQLREIQRAARSRNMSFSEWVRHALSLACRTESSKSVEKKLKAVRAAAQYEFPTADIDRMLAEISGLES